MASHLREVLLAVFLLGSSGVSAAEGAAASGAGGGAHRDAELTEALRISDVLMCGAALTYSVRSCKAFLKLLRDKGKINELQRSFDLLNQWLKDRKDHPRIGQVAQAGRIFFDADGETLQFPPELASSKGVAYVFCDERRSLQFKFMVFSVSKYLTSPIADCLSGVRRLRKFDMESFFVSIHSAACSESGSLFYFFSTELPELVERISDSAPDKEVELSDVQSFARKTERHHCEYLQSLLYLFIQLRVIYCDEGGEGLADDEKKEADVAVEWLRTEFLINAGLLEVVCHVIEQGLSKIRDNRSKAVGRLFLQWLKLDSDHPGYSKFSIFTDAEETKTLLSGMVEDERFMASLPALEASLETLNLAPSVAAAKKPRGRRGGRGK